MLALLAVPVLGAPGAKAQVAAGAIVEGKAPRQLSGFGFFTDPAAQVPAPGVMPYDLITPLFTDYAKKYRFVFVPEGESAPYNPDDVFALPVGSALIKTFAYPADMRAPDDNVRLIETRVLLHTQKGWRAFPYVWDAEMGDALLTPLGGSHDISWVDAAGEQQRTRYLVPNMNQCRSCHVKGLGRDRQMTPIGPEAKHLNHDFPYTDGPQNQLVRWTQAGILTGAPENPDDAPRVADWADATAPLEARARAYLDINCAHCHAPDGPAYTSGLYLDTRVTEPAQYGIFKRPVAAGRGSGGFDFDIVPGDPAHSILHYRMDSTDPGIAMPELGRTMIDREGVELIREWIAHMED